MPSARACRAIVIAFEGIDIFSSYIASFEALFKSFTQNTKLFRDFIWNMFKAPGGHKKLNFTKFKGL
jgi:hypothetical protein